MNTLLFLILTYSITTIISTELIFKWFRKIVWKNSKLLYKLIKCPNCLSFWVSLACSFLFPLPSIVYIFVDNLLWALVGFGVNKLINIYLSDKNFYMEDDFTEED